MKSQQKLEKLYNWNSLVYLKSGLHFILEIDGGPSYSLVVIVTGGCMEMQHPHNSISI